MITGSTAVSSADLSTDLATQKLKNLENWWEHVARTSQQEKVLGTSELSTRVEPASASAA